VLDTIDHNTPETQFDTLLEVQVRSEFTADEAIHCNCGVINNSDLPQLAKYFYRQAGEELSMR
jgi:ferritin